ncbi:beta-ketoacyl synthase, C-terminal domain protein, partial [Vibrio parahaemolyticus V-223/04]
ATVRLLMATTW